MNGAKEVKVSVYPGLVRVLVKQHLKDILVLLLRGGSPGKVEWSENPC